jgi:hypothetical protein
MKHQLFMIVEHFKLRAPCKKHAKVRGGFITWPRLKQIQQGRLSHVYVLLLRGFEYYVWV